MRGSSRLAQLLVSHSLGRILAGVPPATRRATRDRFRPHPDSRSKHRGACCWLGGTSSRGPHRPRDPIQLCFKHFSPSARDLLPRGGLVDRVVCSRVLRLPSPEACRVTFGLLLRKRLSRWLD